MDGRPNPVTILVLGILSLVICAPLGIPAWVMGNNALNMASSYPESDLSMIKVGRILGIIGTCLLIMGCCFYGVAAMAAAGGASSNRF